MLYYCLKRSFESSICSRSAAHESEPPGPPRTRETRTRVPGGGQWTSFGKGLPRRHGRRDLPPGRRQHRRRQLPLPQQGNGMDVEASAVALKRTSLKAPARWRRPATAPPSERLHGQILSLVPVTDPETAEFDIVHKELANPTGLLMQVMRESLHPLQQGLRKVVRGPARGRLSDEQAQLCEMSVLAKCHEPHGPLAAPGPLPRPRQARPAAAGGGHRGHHRPHHALLPGRHRGGPEAVAQGRQPMKRFLKRLVLILLVLAVVGAAVGAYLHTKERPPVAYRTATVTRGDLLVTIGSAPARSSPRS